MEIIIYETKQRSETITQSTRLNDTKYSSWKAINNGTGVVIVDGQPLQPGEGIEHNLQPNQTWNQPIDIQVQAGGVLQLMREIVTPKIKNIKTRA